MTNSISVSKTATERGKIAPVQLAHLVLRTADRERLVKWYQTVLEAEVALSNPVITFLSYDEEHHRVAIIGLPGITDMPAGVAGLDHAAFTYRSPDDLFATYERLKAEGIDPYWTVNHGPTISFYYRDPDGNQLELQFDLFEDLVSLHEWFQNSDFDINPVGVTLDAEDLIRRYRAGEDPSTLFARPVISPDLIGAQMPS